MNVGSYIKKLSISEAGYCIIALFETHEVFELDTTMSPYAVHTVPTVPGRVALSP